MHTRKKKKERKTQPAGGIFRGIVSLYTLYSRCSLHCVMKYHTLRIPFQFRYFWISLLSHDHQTNNMIIIIIFFYVEGSTTLGNLTTMLFGISKVARENLKRNKKVCLQYKLLADSMYVVVIVVYFPLVLIKRYHRNIKKTIFLY